MSSDEVEDEGALPTIVTSSRHLNASGRSIVVIEGKSNCNLKTEEPAFKGDVMRIKERITVLSISNE